MERRGMEAEEYWASQLDFGGHHGSKVEPYSNGNSLESARDPSEDFSEWGRRSLDWSSSVSRQGFQRRDCDTIPATESLTYNLSCLPDVLGKRWPQTMWEWPT